MSINKSDLLETSKIKSEELEKEIKAQKELLSTDKLDFSFGEIINMYERDELIIKPAFQRYFRWDEEQRTRFIESLLLGIPTPPIFVAENDTGVWELVDGLQRVSTVVSFFGYLKGDESIRNKNYWKLNEGTRLKSLAGFDVNSIPNKFRLYLKRTFCRVEILHWNNNYDMRFELFNRLNTGSLPLSAQEIRNCIYRDISPKFNEFLQTLVKNEHFSKLTALNEEQKERLYDEELVLRFMSLFRQKENIKEGLAQHMSNFMKKSLENEAFDYAFYKEIFNNVFHLLAPLGKEIFRNKQNRFTPTLYDIITIGIAENYDSYSQQNSEAILKKIKTISYQESTGESQKARIIKRLEEATRVFGS